MDYRNQAMWGTTFRVITLGCKVNQYESAFLEESLVRSGWRRAGRCERADLVLINTCIVTGRASYQSRQAIRRQIRENTGAVIAVTGCYAQVFPEELAEISGVHMIAGNTLKHKLPGLLCGMRPTGGVKVLKEPFSERTPFEILPVSGHPGRTRAFLKIQDGCNAHCTYCIVPRARGRPRSMDVKSIVKALKGFSREGFLEAVLTGIHLGKYGSDQGPGMDLKALLKLLILRELPLRIRLSSLEPDEIDLELVDLVASNPCLCRHFHVAVQSGDDYVLNRMNRPYKTDMLIEVLETIRKRIPEAAVGADLIVGFPGESDRMFENTRALVESLPISYVHVFRFSPRPGTPASGFRDVVSNARTKERAAVLRALGKKKKEGFFRACLGKAHPVIVEGTEHGGEPVVRGLSDNYLPLEFPLNGADRRRIVTVHAERLDGDRVIGRVETEAAAATPVSLRNRTISR